eukprot:XP_002530703.2 uncharacterized protein LOC8267061 [Ricinus communis]
MDQQSIHMKTHILDLSDQVNISLQSPLIDQNKQMLHQIMSEKELKIRGELEIDIERDLEQEIKDGIYHLALRLHRLYQHQKERNTREILSESPDGAKNHQERRNKILSEVNISIKLEGGTKIEIKETKKELTPDQEKGRPRTARSNYNTQGMTDTKKFDWARTLRSNSGHAAIKRRNERAHDYMSLNLDNARKNLTSGGAGQRKGFNASAGNRLLELGWKC